MFRIAPQSADPQSLLLARAATPPFDTFDPRFIYVLRTANACYVWKHDMVVLSSQRVLAAAAEVIQHLQLIHVAPEQIVHVNAGEEPADFWVALRGTNAEVPVRVIPLEDYDADAAFFEQTVMEDSSEPVSPSAAVNDDMMDTSRSESDQRHSMFQWPQLEDMGLFDSDDLTDNGVFVLIDGSKTIIRVWIGSDFELPEEYDTTQSFAEHVVQEFKTIHPDVDLSQAQLFVEEQGDESDEFFDLFVDG